MHYLQTYNNIKNVNKIEVGDIIEIPDYVLKGASSSTELRSLAPPKQYYKPYQFKQQEQYKPKQTKLVKKKKTVIPKKEDKGFIESITSSDLYNDITGLLKEDTSLSQKFNTLINGVKRKFDLGQEEKTSKLKTVKPTKLVSKKTPKYESKVGDTIRVDDRRYIIPESIQLNGVKLGSRNRGSRTPFKTPGGIIPTYKPIVPYESQKWYSKDSEGNINEFIGYDKNGYFKLGTLDKFGKGDTMTQVYYGWITNVPRDNKGQLLYTTAAKDSRRKSPVVDAIHENGTPYRGSLLLMTGKHEKTPDWNLFGNVTGGAYILQAGNETKLVRGSVNNIISEVESMLKKYKKPIKFYEVDNGSYNRGLRTYDGVYTSNDLEVYDAQNVGSAGGGHFFYFIPETYPAYK